VSKQSAFKDEDVAAITAHMNDDHADAIMLYLDAFTETNVSLVKEAKMIAIDSIGVSISVVSSLDSDSSDTVEKILFSETGTNLKLDNINNARAILVDMVKLARAHKST